MAAKLKIEKRGMKFKKFFSVPIGSYVKLSSAMGAILVEGPNRLTYFWKRTIQ
jgi:hypothetical protein